MAKKEAEKVEKTQKEILRELHDGLDKRPRPEEVAKNIRLLLELPSDQLAVLNKAANARTYSYMQDDFERPDDMGDQLRVAADLFPILRTPTPLDIEGIRQYIKVAGSTIGKPLGKNSFKTDRFDRIKRMEFGLEISKRQYNKRFRFLVRAEDKLTRVAREVKKRFLTLASKSRLASTISIEEFSKNINSAAFIAYYTARCSIRSVFAVKHQERPYDQIAEMLLKRCNMSANWFAIAKVHPVPEVLEHLTEEQKGLLLGKFFAIIQDLAGLMREIWNKSNIDRKNMIVHRGNDSTTWNVIAGAWNKSRDAWINLLYSMGLESVIEEFLPGKALRLMAADVAYMHRSYGEGLEPDTLVWNELPLPWEVVLETATCTKAMTIKACEKVKIDPEKKGWVYPRPKTVAKYTPTPELVHGVVVSNPELAAIFRKIGVFSGKEVKLNKLVSPE